MWGEHNLSNAVGVLALLVESGESDEKLAEGMPGFKGIRRRQEIRSMKKGVTIVDDFAHHPTAVKKTIESMRDRFPGQKLWAVFEPRSNTSRRNIFQNEFVGALALADRVIIARPYREDSIPKDERLDVDALAAAITRRGVDAHSISTTEHIVEFIMRNTDAGDVILVMSNGAFDGLCDKLDRALDKRQFVEDRSTIKPSRVKI
jgi:UDP-N-acetylmuramate: L-alanyl-gamma-D-glutamyl-meso-diaminopimelate ligase